MAFMLGPRYSLLSECIIRATDSVEIHWDVSIIELCREA